MGGRKQFVATWNVEASGYLTREAEAVWGSICRRRKRFSVVVIGRYFVRCYGGEARCELLEVGGGRRYFGCKLGMQVVSIGGRWKYVD